MALNKAQLKQEIAQIMTDMLDREEDSIEEYSTRLSNAIDDYVKSMTITYVSGLVAGNIPVAGSFQHQIT